MPTDLNELLCIFTGQPTVEQRLAKLEAILSQAICKKCGGLSWDVPLADYCKCEKEPAQEWKEASPPYP